MPRLVVIDRERGRREYPVAERITIGRDWSNDIQLLDVKVSRNHAVLEHDAGRFVLRDLASHNGTFVNDDRVAEQRLAEGDRVKIGETLILFEAGVAENEDEEQAPPEAAAEDGSTEGVTVALRGDFEARFLETGEFVRDTDLLVKAYRDLTTLFEIGNILNSERDEEALLELLCQKLLQILPADAVHIMEHSNDGNEPTVRCSLRRDGSRDGEVKLSQAIIRKVVEDQQSVLSYDTSTDERFADSRSLVMHQLRSVMCAPIRSRGRLLGLLFTATEKPGARFSRNDLQMLTAIGLEAGIALENRRLYSDLDTLFLSTIEALANTIDAKDGYTGGHSRRVAFNAVVTGRALGMTDAQLRDLRLGGTLHDIGKIGVPDDVLKLPGRFGPEQRLYMQQHPSIGAEILKPVRTMEDVAGIVRHHHEWFDGTGYPDKLSGKAIPLGARICAITDAFDAITSTRVYRRGRPVELAIQVVTRGAGTQFDPEIVPVFLHELDAGRVVIAETEP